MANISELGMSLGKHFFNKFDGKDWNAVGSLFKDKSQMVSLICFSWRLWFIS